MFGRIKQRGFTLMELLVVILFIIFWIALICVGIHFIAKFW
jgi:type II secretory pathway pseudopilin PulG